MNLRPGFRSLQLLLLLFALASCRPAAATQAAAGQPPVPVTGVHLTATPSLSREPTRTPAPPSATPDPTLTLIPSAAPALLACSPLEGLDRAQLKAAVVNPFAPPPPGSDDPHQGLDLADLAPGGQLALAGRTVRAALAGRVAAVIQDRFPYGNAILVETTLEAGQPGPLLLPTPAPTVSPWPALTCPPVVDPGWDLSARSLYLLYAHLGETRSVQEGDLVACGEVLGMVGSSGNALNPHLHLEARLGPSGFRPGSLAHYDPSASEGEMAAYCTWRVRGVFQALDPWTVLEWTP